MTDQPRAEDAATGDSDARPIRTWPAWLLLTLMAGTWLAPRVLDEPPLSVWVVGMAGPMIGGLLVLLWWLLLSRARAVERIFGLLGTAALVGVTLLVVDPSMRGQRFMFFTVPTAAAAFAIGAALFSARSRPPRRATAALVLMALALGFSTLLRNDGVWGDFSMGWSWRWQATAEDKLLAHRQAQPAGERPRLDPEQLQRWLAEPEWPGFRGADRSGTQTGPAIALDWSTNPPERIWDIPIGPGWSSFAVAGKLLFTQEQRGPEETVVCYAADTGREVWTQAIQKRFDDPMGGPGPRATPTLAGGALFVLGASGDLIRLDPRTGATHWQVDIGQAAGRKPPQWGFCSSPLVVGQAVIVHAGGAGDQGTLAFDTETGELRWAAPAGDHSYCSPVLSTLAGESVVMMLTNAGLDLIDPASGSVWLAYAWPMTGQGYRAVQPRAVGTDGVLVPTGMGKGTRRIGVERQGGAWSAKELWTSKRLKPDFNDFVVHRDHAFGFDGSKFCCIDLATGKRVWRGGRYGNGQVLLLLGSDALLIATELGEVVLVKADPAAFVELGRFRALEGKTWNHPVVVGDRLYLRNAERAVCYRLPLAATSK